MRVWTGILGCGMAALALTVNAEAQPPVAPSAPQILQEKYDVNAERDKLIDKAWAFLKSEYNKPPSKDDPKGLMSGWGPKTMNVPYTAMVLQGLVGTKYFNADDAMIKDSMTWLIESQEASGAWSYMPGVDQLKGIRAVYITSICAQLFAELNGASAPANPWKGKLTNQVAMARDYLKQSQVGNAEGPAPDYKKDTAGYGGWAYSKEEIDKSVNKEGKPPSNMSTTTFAIDALKACGLSEDDPLWEKALTFLKRNQNAGEVQDEGFTAVDKASGKKIKPAEKGSEDHGGAVYSEESSMADGRRENDDGTVTLFSYGSMTYNLLRAYLFAGLKKDSLPVRLAWGWIQRNYTLERVPGFRDAKQHEMGIYYYYLSMAKTLQAWGEEHIEDPDRGLKHNWREDVVKQLAKRQADKGQWVNAGNPRWQEDSPVLCTAYALGALKHTR
ncbi:MAG: hypothetical protein KF696_08255 [Planctomycetes bacterium]|nr:hypothetical protein [Planctomycetota bacterium]MCW8135657.1 hypothetical protein [Planctomycetota bacterium]